MKTYKLRFKSTASYLIIAERFSDTEGFYRFFRGGELVAQVLTSEVVYLEVVTEKAPQ
jgi:hypothetical protein